MKCRKICIINTTQCNLSCVYCYEKKTSSAFNLPKVTSKLKSVYSDSCMIEIYGGEPFLAFNNWRKRSIPTHSGWLYPLTFDAGKGLKEA